MNKTGNMQTPGPGTYRAPSDFGYTELESAVNMNMNQSMNLTSRPNYNRRQSKFDRH